MSHDPAGAFRDGPWPPTTRGPTGSGLLDGLGVAVKDLIDLEDARTGGGTPAWLAEQEPAPRDAPAVARLRASGAHVVGHAHTDELAYSLSGTNVHYGTPTNAVTPRREPGGSSSGSAVAVAWRTADIGLGTDTGGSIRVPAAHQGLYGFRPTHGRVPLEGVLPLAPSFDVVGLLTRTPGELADAASALLEDAATTRDDVKGILLAEDLLRLADPETQRRVQSRAHDVAERLSVPVDKVEVAGPGLDDWFTAFRMIQGREAWSAHGPWLRAADRGLGGGVAERFEQASAVGPEDVERAAPVRERARLRLEDLTADGVIVALPVTAGPSPLLSSSRADKGDWRSRTLRLTCVAPLAGLPAVAVPAATVEDAPVGLSLIAASGHDMELVRALVRAEDA